MAGGWPCSLPYQNYGQNKTKMRTKQGGNTTKRSSDSEREAKMREVALPYPTLIVYTTNEMTDDTNKSGCKVVVLKP